MALGECPHFRSLLFQTRFWYFLFFSPGGSLTAHMAFLGFTVLQAFVTKLPINSGFESENKHNCSEQHPAYNLIPAMDQVTMVAVR